MRAALMRGSLAEGRPLLWLRYSLCEVEDTGASVKVRDAQGLPRVVLHCWTGGEGRLPAKILRVLHEEWDSNNAVQVPHAIRNSPWGLVACPHRMVLPAIAPQAVRLIRAHRRVIFVRRQALLTHRSPPCAEKLAVFEAVLPQTPKQQHQRRSTLQPLPAQ